MLTSKAAIPSTVNVFAIYSYSSSVLPEILAKIGTSYCFKFGNISATNASAPGFSNPIQFNTPDGVSAIRTPALPGRGVGVKPFTEIAPTSVSRSKYPSYSNPNPKVPDAATIGFFMEIPQNSTANLGSTVAIRKTPPQQGIQDHLYTLYIVCHFYLGMHSLRNHRYHNPCVPLRTLGKALPFVELQRLPLSSLV